jgi:3-oxoacyl-[acyl-carrier-protein] synthase II
MNRVVITGLGTVNPLGNDVETFWNNVKAEKCGISTIEKFDTEAVGISVAGQVKDYDPLASGLLEKKECRNMQLFTQYAVSATAEALKDSGTDFKDLDPYKIGVLIGCGIGGIEFLEQQHTRLIEKGPSKISPFFIPMMISNMAAGEVAIKTGFMGDNYAITSACASGTHAIGEAFRKIKYGELTAAVCGGTESTVTEFVLGGFATMKALTKETDPLKASTPFDKNRSGFVLGEGAGILILEEYEHAKARGAKIYAEVAGYGATCDAYHITSPSPEAQAAARAMSDSISEAGLKPEDIDYINAHGTSTPINDKYETRAIKIALGDAAKNVKVNSTKSMTGHLLGAAGGVEAVTCALSIRDGFVHKTLGFETPDEECDLDNCTSTSYEMQVNAALSNSLGFGGHNATLCFKKVD